MKKKLLVIIALLMIALPITVLAMTCEFQLRDCLEMADDPDPCYVAYKECKINEYN